MKPSHFHVEVRDLTAAVDAFERLWEITPVFENASMATLRFGSIGLLLDQSEHDSKVTLAFESDDCHADFERAVERGAQVLQAPEEKPWGVRAAYLRGPGGITFEIEQVLPDTPGG